ncbi:hypothetical protein BDY19DRAFT_1053779 [Irpex rosettiformis]|uniref:Uncharacterized protein n=1 Tax=Irpex rosettiformis TaxID=378272 RepID=A0ACB8UGA1_9APHY|nr:hypothetical protein BDY19DRAFT_1053779 [Irpex rosettiformis]
MYYRSDHWGLHGAYNKGGPKGHNSRYIKLGYPQSFTPPHRRTNMATLAFGQFSPSIPAGPGFEGGFYTSELQSGAIPHAPPASLCVASGRTNICSCRMRKLSVIVNIVEEAPIPTTTKIVNGATIPTAVKNCLSRIENGDTSTYTQWTAQHDQVQASQAARISTAAAAFVSSAECLGD